MLDSIQEITSTIRQNKLRTALTGFSIAWGIFMLILLLGAGNGLRNGVTANFTNQAKNMVSVWPGWTSMPYDGLPSDRRVKFSADDYYFVRDKVPGVTHISGRIYRTLTTSYKEEYSEQQTQGVHHDAAYLNNIVMKEGDGRFINETDNQLNRKVVVISQDMKRTLFNGKNPLGEYLKIGNIMFHVVGVYSDDGDRSSSPVYIPFFTAQMLYAGGWGFDRLDFAVKNINSLDESKAFIELFRTKMGKTHRFDPKDYSAIHIWNTAEDSIRANTMFLVINLILWLIGICSLTAGIVGISNIMLITVKERTREFGIRKAIGAKPGSILRLVLLESVFVTGVFGYVGMILGIGLTEIVSFSMSRNPSSGDGPSFFINPTVDLNVVMLATLLLLIAGVVAAYVPAKRAVKVSPIEAMRAE